MWIQAASEKHQGARRGESPEHLGREGLERQHSGLREDSQAVQEQIGWVVLH